jgi:6,7-dimethyl-8-ribityllumazine synthase
MAGRAPSSGRRVRSRPGLRYAIVVARFNEGITKKLLDGALGVLGAAGVSGRDMEVTWVPGAFELAQAAMRAARSRRFAAVICLGCVIRGATPHFDFLSHAAADGILRVALDTGVPTTFGVITALTEVQAWERAGGSVGNRGEEAALAALEMAELNRSTRKRRTDE